MSTQSSPDAAPVPFWPAVSVVMPVLDEERHLPGAVAQVLEQDYPGELELVLAVGPSRDRTADVVAGLVHGDPGRLRAIDNPTGATPDGLNLAIAAARHEVVVRVDGHALLPPTYVRTAVRLLQETGADNVGGVMAAEGVTPFEQAVAWAMRSPLGVGAARFHTGGQAGPADTVYLGTFRRETLERVGGYDPGFARAQDWEMNYRIRSSGGLVWFSPDLHVTYRPRGTLGALTRQYRDYGRWRRVVMRRYPDTVSLRYLAPPLAVLGVAGGTALGLVGLRAGWLLPVGYVAGVAAVVATAQGIDPAARLRLPAVLAVMHGAWGVGFLTSSRALARTAGGLRANR